MVSPISNIGTSFFSGGFGFFHPWRVSSSQNPQIAHLKGEDRFNVPLSINSQVPEDRFCSRVMLEVSLRNCQDSPNKNTRKQSNWWNLDQVFLELRNNQPSKFVNDWFCLGLWNKHLRSFAKQNISFSKSFSQCLLLLRDLRADLTLDLGSLPPSVDG